MNTFPSDAQSINESQLRNLARQMGKLDAMAFDVDGTIADGESYVSDRTIAALRALSERGIEIIIVTGRLWDSAAEIMRRAEHDGIAIGSNGAIIGHSSTGEIFHSQPLTADESRTIIEIGKKYDLITTIFSEDSIYVEQLDMSSDFLKGAHQNLPIKVQDFSTIEPRHIFKMMFGHMDASYLDEISPEILKHCPSAQRSIDNFFDIASLSEGKGKAMRIVAEKTGISLDRVAGFGDGGNDVDWLGIIGWPVAMGNARAEVKDISRACIGHHADDAVAQFLEIYVQEFDQGFTGM
ncbi:Cof subfamily protein (haloacid dehalogenase superfamily) [Arcanobacterium pluranimalium]|uniref:Cof-type HAD-IIB family hydrolase n=1 Tax=Arcanobacterium pluranimalium TaxID=108028 RepID=UPI00195D6A25|nr:Cof subfamily protein (haloacid dehalogenase superfamily) [Arcanobacterium pluranimalium]